MNRQNPHSSKILKTHLDESFRADKEDRSVGKGTYSSLNEVLPAFCQ